MGTWGVIIPPYQHWLPSDLRFSSLTAKLSQKPKLQAAALAGWALAVYSISAGVSWSDRAAAFGRSTAGKDVVATLFFLVWEPELNIWLLCLCGVCVCVCVCVSVCLWCPMDGCDALIGQRGKTNVQSQTVWTVHVYTQPWAQHYHE